MGPHAQGGGLQDGHPHGQASRRILPVAHGYHTSLGSLVALERWEGRCGERVEGGVRQIRPEVRRIPLAVGSQRRMLRRLAPLQPAVHPTAHRIAHPLRRDSRGVVRRCLRRRPQRQETGLRLGCLLQDHTTAATQRRDGHHGRRRAVGRQREGIRPGDRVERHGSRAGHLPTGRQREPGSGPTRAKTWAAANCWPGPTSYSGTRRRSTSPSVRGGSITRPRTIR